MSTVLKAAEELKRDAAQSPPTPTQRPAWQQRLQLALIGGLLFAFGGITVFLVAPTSRQETTTIDADVGVPAVPAQERADPRSPSTVAAPVAPVQEAPWGRVVEVKPAPAAVRPVTAPRVDDDPKPAQRIVAPAAAAPDAQAAPRRAEGGHGLRVRSITYSGDQANRSVTLEIGGKVVVLHEGESADDVEVQLILPNTAYIRTGASVIAIRSGS